jgi:hypothetical protein
MSSNKAQFAVEFMVLIAFMFLIFVGAIAVITSRVTDSRDDERLKLAEDISVLAKNEIELAREAGNGYQRNFEMPLKVDGNSYDVEIIDNRELIVNFVDKEHVEFLPENVCGDIFIPENEIDKINDVVCVNSNLDLEQCDNAQSLGICQDLEDLMPGTICCCQKRYNRC